MSQEADTQAGKDEGSEGEDVDEKNDEIFEFPGVCLHCGGMKKGLLQGNTNHVNELREYRDNEVKAGSANSEKGKKVALAKRTWGGTFSRPGMTLSISANMEYLEDSSRLDQVHQELSENFLLTGDSSTAEEEDPEKFTNFLNDMKAIRQVEQEFTVIVDDPLANSYVQNIYAPDPDPNMTIEIYERSWEQNEELGLNDMKVESYSEGDSTEADDDKGDNS